MFDDVEEFVPDDKKPLKYYYNRQERLENAPQIVKDFYEGKNKPVRGLKVFFTKQNRYITFALIIFIGAVWGYSGLNKTRAYATLNGINYELSAFSYDEKIYVTLKFVRNPKIKDTSPVKVDAVINMVDNSGQISDKRESSLIYDEGEKYIREKFTDYDIIRVDVSLFSDGKEKEVSAKVKR